MIRTTPRCSRRVRRCDCGTVIRPGDAYLEHTMSPGHGDIGCPFWLRFAECMGCASRYGRAAVAEGATS